MSKGVGGIVFAVTARIFEHSCQTAFNLPFFVRLSGVCQANVICRLIVRIKLFKIFQYFNCPLRERDCTDTVSCFGRLADYFIFCGAVFIFYRLPIERSFTFKSEDCTRSVLFEILTSSHRNAQASETRSPVYIINTRSFEAFPYIQRLCEKLHYKGYSYQPHQ